VIWVQEPKNLDKKIVTITAVLLICISGLSLVTPATSKKPDKTAKELPNNATANELGIEIYWDSKCTTRVSLIDWGSLEPETSKTVTLFIKNKGKTPLTLSHYVANCEPFEITNWLTLTWDYTGQSIEFKEVVQVVFKLYVSENADPMETFSFDIVIVDTQ
jgi:hypothetical protein